MLFALPEPDVHKFSDAQTAAMAFFLIARSAEIIEARSSRVACADRRLSA
ncbi:MAG: hypothetical protein KGJ78_16020 [Alphaproteobacteria bacterium]|nr:hypothetical protein [Alphaproteobacteria bacterium]